MNILTLSSFSSGGAAKGSFRRISAISRYANNTKIHLATLQPYETNTFTQLPVINTLNQDEFRSYWERYSNNAHYLLKSIPGYCSNEAFYIAIDGNEDIWSQLYNSFDLIHLHWVNGMINYSNSVLASSTKPVIWTFADMNPFTGGCHYSQGCHGYIDGCLYCPLLGGKNGFTSNSWHRKHSFLKSIPNLHVICPSDWLAEHARRSPMLNPENIHVIRNPNSASVKPTSYYQLRRAMDISDDQVVLLVGAESTHNVRKGIDITMKALDIVWEKASADIRDSIVVLKYGSGIFNTKFKCYDVGSFGNEDEQSVIFSAADVMCFTSLEDNSPLVVQEALQYGVSVIATESGDVYKLINNMQIGRISPSKDFMALADSIIDYIAFMLKSDRKLIRSSCIQRSECFYNPQASVAKHISLYSKAKELESRFTNE